jgi:C4-dicarboxylate transporter DctQ subunit
MDRWLCRAEEVAMAILMVGALGIGFMQVFLRYVLNTGFPWSEGILITLAVWAAMIGGGRAVRDKLHVRVEVFADALPPKPRKIVNLLAHGISLAYCAMMAWFGWLYTKFVWQLGNVSFEAYIPEWMIYGVVPAALGLFVIRYVQRIWLILTDQDEEDDIDTEIARSL